MAKDLLNQANEARKKWKDAKQVTLQRLSEFDTAEFNLQQAEKDETWAVYVYHTALEELASKVLQ